MLSEKPSLLNSSSADGLPRMYVVKRDGRKEDVHFCKIHSRIKKLCYCLSSLHVDPAEVTIKVVAGIYMGVTTVELDNLAAEVAASMTTRHPDFAVLAARIAISNLHKQTKKGFSAVMSDLYNFRHPMSGKHSPMISPAIYKIIMDNERKEAQFCHHLRP